MRNFSQLHNSSKIIHFYSCNDEYSKSIHSQQEICDIIKVLFEKFEERFSSIAEQCVLVILDTMRDDFERDPKKFRATRWTDHHVRMWDIINDGQYTILATSEIDAMLSAIMFCLPLWLDKYDMPSSSYAYTYANLNTGASLVMIYTVS